MAHPNAEGTLKEQSFCSPVPDMWSLRVVRGWGSVSVLRQNEAFFQTPSADLLPLPTSCPSLLPNRSPHAWNTHQLTGLLGAASVVLL